MKITALFGIISAALAAEKVEVIFIGEAG